MDHKINSFIGKQVVIMVFDILYRHWVTIFTILVFTIKLWPGKRFRNTETKYFWLTVLSTLILVIEDIIEVLCASDPSLRFVRIFVSVIGYTMRSVAGLSLLLVVLPYKKRRFIYWIPALITLATSSTAIFSDIAFGYDENYDFYRGPLGYVAFAVPIFYAIMILVIVFKNFYEKSSIERFIVPVCTIFCLTTSFLDAMYGGVRLNEAIIISGVFFYLILYSNDIRRDSLTNLLNRIRPEDFLFLDTETTGLSGGAGTVAFEVGLGFIEPRGMVIRQYVMRDYSGEGPMLEEIASLLKRFDTVVTFNGKSFDLPLLESRMVMSRHIQPNSCETAVL